MESNHYEMKPRFQRLSFSLKKLANCVDSMLFHCFYDASKFVSKYISKTLSYNLSKLCHN